MSKIYGILLLRDCTANGITLSSAVCMIQSDCRHSHVMTYNDTGFRVPLAFWVQVEKPFEEL